MSILFDQLKSDEQSPGTAEVSDANTVVEAVLNIFVDNEPGALARIVGMISARGYNIESLSVAETGLEEGCSRVTLVTTGTQAKIEQIKAQLSRIIPVRSVSNVSGNRVFLERDYALLKLGPDNGSRDEAVKLAEVFGARPVYTTDRSLIFEVIGEKTKIDTFIEKMKSFDPLEVSRTGVVTISRD